MALLRVLGLGAAVLVSWGFGLTLLKALRVPPLGTAARAVLALGLALGANSLLALALGALGLLGWASTFALAIVQVGLAVLSRREMVATLRRLPEAPRLLALPLLLWISVLLSALAPPVAYDAANEHYPLAKVPASEGRLVMRDELRYSANGGLHGLYMLAFTVGREEEANLVWLLFVGFLPIAAYAAGRELFSRQAGVLAALLAAFYPYADSINISWMEKPSACFLLLACLSAAKARDAGGLSWAALTGFFSGICIQARPTCAPALAVPLVLLLSRRPTRQELGALAGTFLLAALPWRLGVWLSTGSPFPLSHPASELVEWAGARASGSLLDRHLFFLGSLLLPLPLGPAAWVGTLGTLLSRGRPGPVNRLLAVGAIALGVYYLGTLALGPRLLAAPFHTRYFSTFSIPLTSLLAAWAWDRLMPASRLLPWALGATLALQAAFVGLADLRRAAVAWPAVAGRMDRDSYLRGQIGPYAAIEHLNRTVRPGEMLLYAGRWQGFLDVRYRYVDQALHAKLGREEYLARAREVQARHLGVLREVADRLDLGVALRETYRDAHLVVYEIP